MRHGIVVNLDLSRAHRRVLGKSTDRLEVEARQGRRGVGGGFQIQPAASESYVGSI